jgi:hypothetical protein
VSRYPKKKEKQEKQENERINKYKNRTEKQETPLDGKNKEKRALTHHHRKQKDGGEVLEETSERTQQM